MWRALHRLRRRRSTRAGDAGFTVIEMIIASLVILMVMTALASALTGSLVAESFSKQRQTATALADQSIEQVRALPFTTVATGLSSTDISATQAGTNPDPDIQGSSAPYTFAPTGEQIVAGSSSPNPPAPLYPYRNTTAVNGTSYTLATYVTKPSSSTCAGCYRVTVIASWAPGQGAGNPTDQVSSQTIVFSPTSGCLSASTHPFAAPCEPSFYAQATSGQGGITITQESSTVAAISDPNNGGSVQLQQANLGLVEDDSTLQVEQSSQVSGNAQTGEALLDTTTGYAGSTGGATGTAQADNDPANPSNMSAPATVSQGSTTTLTQSTNSASAGNSLSLATSTGDTGSLISSTSVSASQDCYDLSGSPGTAQTTGLPCASGSMQQSGSGSGGTALATLGLASPSSSLGTATLASVAAASSPARSFTALYQTSGGGSSECTSPSGPGCVHAGATTSVGAVDLGGLPSGISAPTGWSSVGYLVQISNYSASVSAESGGGAASPAARTSYTIKYWNGSGYSSTSTAGTALSPSLSLTSTVNGKTVVVTMTSSFTTGASSTSTGSPASAQVTSPLTGSIAYSVTVNGTNVVNLNVGVNLGTLLAQTNYQAAPSGG